MKAYSMDLRKRVLAVYDCGRYTLKEVADQFQVTTRWIQQLRQRRELEGSIAPHPQNQGRKPAFSGTDLSLLNDFVKKHPDATLEEIKEYFSGTVDCSIVAIHTTLKRLGWNYKKKHYMHPSKTGRMSP